MIVVDDLVTGLARRLAGVPVVQVDLAETAGRDTVAAALKEYRVDAVIHLAARKQVGESLERPAWYYQQNVASLANVVMAMEQVGVARLVFSSSAAVYAPTHGAVTEDHPVGPENPYGDTKLVGERMLSASAAAFGLTAASLRYFNVAGAGAPELGDTAALNLVPMVFERLDAGESPRVFGDDYETPDGTCVRDFVHVLDVAEAHLATLDAIDSLKPGHHIFNIGTGVGVSVREMVDMILRVSGSKSHALVEPRRPGDAASVVASVQRIRELVGWQSRLGLADIVESAWASHELLGGSGS